MRIGRCSYWWLSSYSYTVKNVFLKSSAWMLLLGCNPFFINIWYELSINNLWKCFSFALWRDSNLLNFINVTRICDSHHILPIDCNCKKMRRSSTKRKAAGKKAVRTRARNKAKRSAAARKAARTRRMNRTPSLKRSPV